MKRLPFCVVAVLLALGGWTFAEEEAAKKVMILPFKMVQDSKVTFSNELAAVVASELKKEGEVNVMPGAQYAPLLQGRLDPAKIARIARRGDLDLVLGGECIKLDDGYSLEVWVVGKDSNKKPKLFSTTGEDMEKLLARVSDLAVDIGSEVLQRPKIKDIKIEGNLRVNKEAILNKIEMKPGQPFRKSRLGDEIRDLYSMGYFDDVQIQAEETPQDGE
ncbi:MAG: POTRA domain-containing protein, partial [Pseudomonadota bacterium]